ncbi:MAG TPA: hypothetical protein VF883_01935 [Thermoanaerobaculia bacterium]|jgi:hypothetical protein
MPQLTVDLDVLRHALFDHSLSQVGDSLLQAKVTSSLKVTNVVFKPSAELAVRVLNRAEDKDEDSVFGKNDAAHIPFALQSAWVKYRLAAKAEGKIPLMDAALGASGDVALIDYRLHSATDDAWSAVTNDLGSPRTLFDLDDVKKLQPGEALAMELGGALTASVSFSWSDVLATKLPELFSGHTPVSVKLKSGLTTSAAVKVTDTFSVVISRTGDGHYRFAVKKAATRSNTFGIDVSLGLDVSGAPGVEEVLDAIFADAPEQALKLREVVKGKLEEAVRWKASAGFEYEYARIKENDSIADFLLLDDTRLAGDHALVLGGNFAKISDALRQDVNARRLVNYLNQSTLTRRSSFGFTLGLGKWALKTQDTSKLEMMTRTSLDGGFQLITCSGTRKYDEKNVPQNDFEWTVDLKAQMKEFLANPTSRDFDYGLHLLMSIDRGAIREDDLERMLDLAAMWDVAVPPLADFAEAIGRKGSLRVQLTLDRDELASAIAHDTDVASWAEPLAMAMPYMSNFPERRTFAARRDTYTKAWREWLESGQTSAIRVNSGLTLFERTNGPGSFAWTVGEGHPQLRRRLDAFAGGGRKLRAAMTTAQKPEAIGDAYDDLSQFWSQRLYVAAVGRWLVERGATHATLQVEYADVVVTA